MTKTRPAPDPSPDAVPADEADLLNDDDSAEPNPYVEGGAQQDDLR